MNLTEAMEGLPPHEMARLKFCFEQGTSACVKLKCGLYVGVHMDQLPHMESIESQGRWSLCRKLEM